MAIGSIVGMGLSLAGGLFGAGSAKKAARAAARIARDDR